MCLRILLLCIVYTNFAIAQYNCAVGTKSSYAKGDNFELCVFLSLKNRPSKLNFRIKVDEHTAMRINGTAKIVNDIIMSSSGGASSEPRALTWVSLTSSDARPNNCQFCNTTMMQAQNCTELNDPETRQHIASCAQTYQTVQYVAPFVNLRIYLNDGKVQKLDWVNECYDCASTAPNCLGSPEKLNLSTTSILPERLGLEDRHPICAQAKNGGRCHNNGCDLFILVTWEGTDSKGNTLVSKAYGYPEANRYQFGGWYNSILEFKT